MFLIFKSMIGISNFSTSEFKNSLSPKEDYWEKGENFHVKHAWKFNAIGLFFCASKLFCFIWTTDKMKSVYETLTKYTFRPILFNW
jgi:hypothetical protein